MRLLKLAAWFLAAAAAMAAASVAAQDFPAKPIRLIVPNTPGGATDVAARMVGPKLSELLGQPVVVENRVAAGGVVGTNQVAQSAADGYTLIMVFDSFATNPYLYKGVQYDPVRDFAPISLVAKSPQLLVVHPGLGVKSYKEFLQLAKSKGSALDFATAGAGTSSRLSLELFKLTAGIDPTAVHYKGGGAALNDLLGGQVKVMIISMGVIVQHVRNGKLLALATTSARRVPLLPEVPTVGEFTPGFEAQSWLGLLAPAATPRGIVERLNAAVLKALALRDVREKFESLGSEVAPSTPEAFGEWIRTETTKWGRVIRERKITLD